MKKFIQGLLIILFSFHLQAFAGPGDHFPWGAELPFPWKDIQGTWSTQMNGVDAYVIFKIVRSDAGYRQLKISILNPQSCRTVAVGAGYEENRVVKAVVANGGRTSKVTVHVFREADIVPDLKHASNDKQTVTIMSVAPMNGSEADKTAFELTKVNNDSKANCQ